MNQRAVNHQSFNQRDDLLLSTNLTRHLITLRDHVATNCATRACDGIYPTIRPQIGKFSLLSQSAE